jgi:hypothetical protein
MTTVFGYMRGLFVCLAIATALAAVALCHAAFAEEAAFGLTHTTDLPPKGAWQSEQWATRRFTRIADTYDGNPGADGVRMRAHGPAAREVCPLFTTGDCGCNPLPGC